MNRIAIFAAALLTALGLCAQTPHFYGPDRLSSTLITAITQTADGFLWVGTDHGLNRFDGYTFTEASLPIETGGERLGEISVLCSDNDGRLWVGTARGLLLYDRATDNFMPVSFPDSIVPRVSKLAPQYDGSMAVGTAGFGTFIVNASDLTAQPKDGSIPEGEEAFIPEETLAPELRPLTPTGMTLTCSVQDTNGNIYIGTRGNGLFFLPAHESTLRPMEVALAGVDLNRTNIRALFIDRGGNLWVGCQQRGLLMVPLNRTPLFQTWSFAAQRQVTGTCVSSITTSATSPLIWCSVEGDGVYGFDAEGHIQAHPSAPMGVSTLYCDSEDRYWLGTSNGLWSYDPQTGHAQCLEQFPGDRVNIIKEVGDHLLAISAFGNGLYLYDTDKHSVRRYLTMNDTDTIGRGRLSNDWIFSIDTDSRGRLWIATSSGVDCYDPVAHTFRSEGWAELNGRQYCTALKVLASDDVILASEHGVQRWSHDQGLRNEAALEPMRGKTICYITEDAEGDIWFSTNEGIWQYRPKEETLVAYVGAYGLKEREFVQGAGLQAADGKIYFGTADGITSFLPDDIRHAGNQQYNVHLTAFVIGGQPANTLTRSNGKAVMEAPVADCHHFSISYVDATFRLEFSLLDFAVAEGVSFEYRMKGESRWQQTTKGANGIAFSHLSPGSYHLEVRARCAGAYTPTETYLITVRPPWWKSTGAYFVYLLLALAVAAAFAYAYRRHVQHQMDREKLHLLISATQDENTPLTLDDLRRAIARVVQSRRQQLNSYGNAVHVVDKMERPEVRGNDEALMDRVIQSVNQHLGDSDFTVEQLCADAGISRAHLHRKMKELTGLPVTEFIRNIRLEQAARLLREQKLNITQVAYTVGFSNLGYFSTVFRKHFGISPRDFIEQNHS